MRRTPPLDELQPPPYQDENGSPRMSCTLSDLGDAKCDLSQTSGSPHLSFGKCLSEGSDGQESEGYLNKGYEEDAPSDSTAVLSPEVNAGLWSADSLMLLLDLNLSSSRTRQPGGQLHASQKATNPMPSPSTAPWMWCLTTTRRSSS